MSTTTIAKAGSKNVDQVILLDATTGDPASLGGGTQYTEDAAAAANPVGTTPILVRKDTPSTTVSDDGDNIAQRGTNYGAAYVTLLDTSGNAVSVGGGTQYTEGDTDASITGTAMLMEGAANALVPAQGTVADGLLVNLGANNDVTVAGVSTEANQTTIISHLDGVEGLLTTIDADTSNISTKIDTIAGAVAGTEMQVDVLTMPTVQVQSNSANLATQTTAAAIQTSVELIDDTVATLGTTTYTEAATKGLIIGAVRRDADTTLANTTNEITPLQVDANGYLKVEVFSGQTLPVSVASGGIASGAIASGAVASGAFASGSIASGAIAAGAIAAGATSIADNEDVARAEADRLVKVAQVRVDAPPAGANVSGTEDYTQFIADSYGKTWVAGSVTEDVAHAAGESVMGNGVRRIDTAATSAGSSGDWATMDASAEGALWVTTTPTTTSGCLTFRSIDLDETEEEVKATAGNIYGYYFYNAAASIRYLKFYNATAASTTVGTTTPMRTYPIPAGAAGHVSLAYPIAFSTALSVAVTTGLADNDTGAPGTNDFIINIDYK